MPTRIIKEAERQELKETMLFNGLELLKKNGMTHTSVRKVTEAAGLGSGTFYHFFSSKEMFVLEMIQYQREQQLQKFYEILAGRDKMTIQEGKEFAKHIILNQDNIFRYLTPEEEEKLIAVAGNSSLVISQEKENILKILLSHIEGVKPNIKEEVISNLFKIMGLALFHKSELDESVLEETFEHIYQLIFSLLFE